MPELPEVETVARMLQPSLIDRAVVRGELLWPGVIDRPAVDAFLAGIIGRKILAVGRRSKYITFTLDNDWTWVVHLRMTGKFFVCGGEDGSGEDRHTRARFQLDDGRWLLFSDQRKFGRFYLVEDTRELFGHLGPEPLEVTFTPDILAGRLDGRRGEIKRVLLDQEIVAGLGNIYASEALWRASIHPQRVASSLTVDEVQQLHVGITTVLQEAVMDGGTSLGDRQYVYPDGGLGRHQLHLAVYDRTGEPCLRCGRPIERTVLGQRSTYFCPYCQIENVK